MLVVRACTFGDESGASVQLRQDDSTDTAYIGRYGRNAVPAGSPSYIVPADTHIHFLNLYRAFLQIKSLI